MRAVRWHGKGDVRVEEVPPARRPGPHEVRVRVAWCGLCGTDVHEYRSGPHYISTVPVTMGHEISGWVDAVGEGVTGLAVGDLVGLNALLPCFACAQCLRGAPHLCLPLRHLGLSADGGLGEFVTVPDEMVVAAPAGMDSAVAALGEPFSVAMHAIRQADRPQGMDCVVVGAGTIGLAVAMLLRDDGNDVVVIDVAAQRLNMARELGFRAAASVDLQAPVVFECAGAPSSAGTAFDLAAPSGLVVLIGLPEVPGTVDLRVVVGKELRVVGSLSHLTEPDLAPALEFLGRHGERAARMITARIPLADAVTRGLDVLAGPYAADHTKIMVRVDGGSSER